MLRSSNSFAAQILSEVRKLPRDRAVSKGVARLSSETILASVVFKVTKPIKPRDKEMDWAVSFSEVDR